MPWHGRIGRRRRRKHEQARLGQPTILLAESRPLAEGAAIRLLADKADPQGTKLVREALQACCGVREVGAAQISRARRRTVDGVRQPDSFGEQVVLLVWLVQARGEAGCVTRRSMPTMSGTALGGGFFFGGGVGVTRVEMFLEAPP